MGAISQFMANPRREHYNIVKRILRYIKGTSNAALYFGGSKYSVKGYIDSNFANNPNKKKSTTSCVHTYKRNCELGFKTPTIVVLSTI